MKILFITSSYLPHYGGLETVVREVACRIQQQGHEVAIITNRYPRNLKPQEEIEDISVTRMFFLYPTWQQLRSGRFVLWFASLMFFPFTLVQLFIYLLRFQPDVVNLHYPNDQILFVWLLSYLFSFPLVVSLHGGDVDAEPHKSAFKLWLFRLILKRANRITACSNALLNQAQDLQPNILTKSITIHNGVYADVFLNAEPYQHQHRYILGVGKIEYHKGFDTLIHAFIEIAHENIDVDVLIAGDGSETRALLELVRLHQLDSRVVFLGRKSREEVASLMKGADTIVIPSRREPFGIVGVEAMASGRPIIVSQVGGLSEAMEEAEAHWVHPDNVDDLIALLRLVLHSQPAGISIEQNCRIAASKDWNNVAKCYLNQALLF